MLIFDAAGYAFLEQCLAGETVGQAATSALEINSTADLKSRIAQFIALGAFMPIVDTASNRTGDHE